MQNIKDLASYIDITLIPKDWINYYDKALELFDISIFNDKTFQEIIDFYQFNDNHKNKLYELWKMVQSDNNLALLVYIWYYIFFEVNLEKRNKWKTELNYFNSHGSKYLPYLALLLGFKHHELTMKNYSLKQINIQKENIRDLFTFDFDRYNYDGVRFSSAEWGSRFIRGSIVQIGVLQFELKPKFYNNQDVIFIHIPTKTKFDLESVNSSLNNKNVVFDYFKVNKNILFVTETWLLSPELKDILKENSNILNFQKHFNIVQYEENESDFLKFVFQELFNNKDNLKENTSLQKGLKKKILNNEKLHIGLGILK